MDSETINSDLDYDTDSTNEFFVAGWDPYVVHLTQDEDGEPAPEPQDTSELTHL